MKKALLFMAIIIIAASSLVTVAIIQVWRAFNTSENISNVTEKAPDAETSTEQTNNLQFLEKPVSYEGKEKAVFKVFKIVTSNAALALESEYDPYCEDLFSSKMVLIFGENLYCNKIVTINQPKQVGTLSYPVNFDGTAKVIPVVRE